MVTPGEEKAFLRLKKTRGATRSKVDNESLRQELKFLRDKNLEQATFEDKLDIITKLGIKVLMVALGALLLLTPFTGCKGGQEAAEPAAYHASKHPGGF